MKYTVIQLLEKGVLAVDEGMLKYEPSARWLMTADEFLRVTIRAHDEDVVEGSIVIREDGTVDYATPCGFDDTNGHETTVAAAIFTVETPVVLEI